MKENLTYISKSRGARGLFYTKYYLDKSDPKHPTFKYTNYVSRVIRYPCLFFFALLIPFVPLTIIVPRFLQGERPYFNKKEIKEQYQRYFDSLHNHDFLLETPTYNHEFPKWFDLKNWCDIENIQLEDYMLLIDYLIEYAKVRSLSSSQYLKAQQKYLGYTFKGRYQVLVELITCIKANIRIPENKIKEMIERDKEYYSETQEDSNESND